MANRAAMVFENGGNDFEAFYDAVEFVKKSGFVVGDMDGDNPVAFADEDMFSKVHKWHNISDAEKKFLSGVLQADDNDYRHGAVKVTFWA